jgi:uncharacterized protein (DUF362 family)
MSLVSFAKVKNNNIKQAISTSLDLIDYSLPKNARNIVIKPNMCYYWDYSTGQTTDPKFVAALIKLIREKISPQTISIVESDASAMKCKYAFKMLGYEKLSQNYNVNLINLSEDKCDDVKVTVGNQSFRLMVPRTIRDADLKINIPKIKYTFERIKLTCALKNIFGCNPYPKKFKYHSKIEEAIVALNKAMKFDLCIIDGNIVSAAKPRRIGLAMASKDLVAIDVAAAKIAGINPKTVRYLALAAKEGLGQINFIQKGIPLDYFKARYPRKGIRQKLMGKAYGLIVTLGLNKKLGLA